LKDGGVVKTTRFRNPTYVGDPINAVRIFTDREVDELFVLDISASYEGRKPDIERIKDVVAEAFMPVGYGGGIADIGTAEKILEAGVEKIVLNTAAVGDLRLVGDIAARFGSQAVVASIDAKTKLFGGWEAYTHGGRKKSGRDPVSLARSLIDAGAGEILLTSMDRDGTRQGYDLELIRRVAEVSSVPVIACGGAGNLDHFAQAVDAGASAVSAASVFVHHGPHRGVLISYPDRSTLENLLP
jgi:cyclase